MFLDPKSYPNIFGLDRDAIAVVPQSIRSPIAEGVPLVNQILPLDTFQGDARSNAKDPARILASGFVPFTKRTVPDTRTALQKFLESPAAIGGAVALVLFGGYLIFKRPRR